GEVARVALLEESERVRDMVLGAVSHDLRTPITTIRTLAQHPVPAADSGARIDEQAARLERLVGNLLDLSRMRADAFPITPEPNVAEDLLGAVARQAHGVVRDATLAVQHDPTGELLLGRFDFAQLVRALGNLVDNALHVSPPGAVVDLSAAAEGEWLVFTVADRGPGIATDDAERIYAPFQRGHDAARDGGTGLGLAIARALAQAHGGWLRHTPRPGGGTTFRLAVPLVREP
ncbi:MAG: ATP-binding protein, partial [Gemmatimonadaceae bacterium]|nr:ATP-binding protein [Gemmatimonadaceae bacterium]